MKSKLEPVSSEELQARNIERLAIPNPFFEGRNQVYVLTSDPITVVDTGVATERAWLALKEDLEKLRIGTDQVERVLLTHKHIDHIGNAWRFHKQGGATIFISQAEQHAVEDVDPVGKRYEEMVRGRAQNWGIPTQVQQTIPLKSPWTWDIESVPSEPLPNEPLQQGSDLILSLPTPGHTFGSTSFQWNDTLVSGDHVLPTISPNVGGGDLRHQGLLSHYLDSLNLMLKLPSDTIVLPGHGQPFRGLHDRCQELIRHHERRLEQVTDYLLKNDEPRSAYEVACHLYGSMKDFHVILGCAEAGAHLELLVSEKQVSLTPDGYTAIR